MDKRFLGVGVVVLGVLALLFGYTFSIRNDGVSVLTGQVINKNSHGFYTLITNTTHEYSWDSYGCGSGAYEHDCVDEVSSPNTLDGLNAVVRMSAVNKNYIYSTSSARDEVFSVRAGESIKDANGRSSGVGEYYNIYIHNISINYTAQQAGSIKNIIQPFLLFDDYGKYDGVEKSGPEIVLSNGWRSYAVEYEKNPFTGQPWTFSDLTKLRLGLSVPDKFNGGGKVSQVFVDVRYCPIGETTQQCFSRFKGI
ncbi:MAG: hypothetical protein AABX73_04075 [Nanoarchaeota archaeon]